MGKTNIDTVKERTYIINHIKMLLDQLIELEKLENPDMTIDKSQIEKPQEMPKAKPGVPVMLTIKECVEQFDCLKEFTVRWLVKNNKVKYIRPGDTGKGRVLINRDSIVEYLESKNNNNSK